ncbi:acyltransferase [Bifidobacterium platyrrhinorum]|nr:acyltransferase [Bifidobacterium platyrrhinorum]
MWMKCASYPRRKMIRFGVKFIKLRELGLNVRFGGKSELCNSYNMIIGSNVFIGDGCYFNANSLISIGDGTMIGPHVFCYAGTHNYGSSDLNAVPFDDRYIDAPVIIEENVWIAGNVSIAPGTHIGKGAVIGMGCTVAGEIPPYAVVVGDKAHVIKYRDAQRYEELAGKGRVYGDVFAGKGFTFVKKTDLR